MYVRACVNVLVRTVNSSGLCNSKVDQRDSICIDLSKYTDQYNF